MTECIGDIIYDETIKQNSHKEKIPELISKMGSSPGIKVDTGAKNLVDHLKKKLQKVRRIERKTERIL